MNIQEINEFAKARGCDGKTLVLIFSRGEFHHTGLCSAVIDQEEGGPLKKEIHLVADEEIPINIHTSVEE